MRISTGKGPTTNITPKLVDKGLKLLARLPGDPLTKEIAKRLPPDSTVKRTGDASWSVTHKGSTYEASVSGTNVTIKGPNGTQTHPINLPAINVPGNLPQGPKVKLPELDLKKAASAIVDPLLRMAVHAAANAPGDPIGSAIKHVLPGSTVTRDGPGQWTVNTRGLESPIKVQLERDALVATQDGKEIARQTFNTGDAAEAVRRLFAGR